MAVTIEGAKIATLIMSRDKETGAMKITGNYELISSTGIVLAKQSINGYQEIAVANSQETTANINNLIQSFQKDLNGALGLN